MLTQTMRHNETRLLRGALTFAAVLALWHASSNTRAATTKNWYKGNLHTHTVNSDGDSTPMEVAAWYKSNRYNFLILSDHNYLTDITGLNAVHAATEKFLLIPGEEVTDRFGNKPVHVNAYNLTRLVNPTHGGSLVETIQGNVNAIRAADALPSVNHPNFGWAMTSRDLMQVNNLAMLEVYNGHPGCNNRGGGEAESLDEMWDALLTGGKRPFGIAVDDAHHFKITGKQYSNPGRGWVVARAERLGAAEIAAALASGDFYASTGIELSDVQADGKSLRVEIKQAQDFKYRTLFIGDGGRILKTVTDRTAVYGFTGQEKYVRARVESSNGDQAWLQPVWTK